MLCPLLLTLSLAAPQVGAPGRAAPSAHEPAFDFATVVGGAPANPFAPTIALGPTPWPRVYEVILQNAGTGWAERFHIGVPPSPLRPAPLLVAFHGASQTHSDIGFNTSYFQDAMARGWFVVAPLGAHEWNYGVPYAQTNVEAALDWVVDQFLIDPDRIYGLGFSMGGGMAASYAARHLDPAHPRFAAIVNHTGSTSLRYTHDHGPPTLPSILQHPDMFGGTPHQIPFRYQQASTIDLDGPAYPGIVDPEVDMGRNLLHLPVLTAVADGEPVTYLAEQSAHFHDHLTALGGDATWRSETGAFHGWGSLPEAVALDFLEAAVLTLPPTGTTIRTLADRNGTWHHFEVTQAIPDRFTPFRWEVKIAANQLFLDETANLAEFRFAPDDLGLDGSAAFRLVLGELAGFPLTVVLDGYVQAPSDVLRNGSGAPWVYDVTAHTITFTESDGVGSPVWTVLP